jgi:hypothetical protein
MKRAHTGREIAKDCLVSQYDDARGDAEIEVDAGSTDEPSPRTNFGKRRDLKPGGKSRAEPPSLSVAAREQRLLPQQQQQQHSKASTSGTAVAAARGWCD